jgi:hypothetical protein
MFKWVSWVIRMGATALLLSFLCIWTTGYIVNSYMETVIKQLDLPIDTQPFALSGVWGKLWGADKYPQVKDAAESKPPTDKGSTADNAAEPTNSANESVTDEAGISSVLPSNDGNLAEKQGVDASPSPSPSPDDGNVDSIPVFNGQSETGQLTDAERQSLYAMVVSKLNQDQLKLLSDSLQGGMTKEELGQVENMLKGSLSEEEYAKMMEMLQGNTKPGTGSTGAAEQ